MTSHVLFPLDTRETAKTSQSLINAHPDRRAHDQMSVVAWKHYGGWSAESGHHNAAGAGHKHLRSRLCLAVSVHRVLTQRGRTEP